jgi:hypothetical protein
MTLEVKAYRVEVLVLLLPHVGQRQFLAWDDQIALLF